MKWKLTGTQCGAFGFVGAVVSRADANKVFIGYDLGVINIDAAVGGTHDRLGNWRRRTGTLQWEKLADVTKH